MYKIPLLVISCDKYSDLWEPFFTIFWQKWPGCPYPVYLGTNHKIYPDDRVTTLNVGDDSSWASGVLAMLDQLQTEYIILFLEDFLILQHVDTTSVNKFVCIAVEQQLGCLRLAPLPGSSPSPTEPVVNFPDFDVVSPMTFYRVSAQPAIWRVSTLRRLLIPGFNAWEFEEIGTQLSEDVPDIFWGPRKPTIVYGQYVEKGKWKPEGLALCQEAGIHVDLEARPAFKEDELKIHYKTGELAHWRYSMRLAAIQAFCKGQRLTGLRFAWQCLCRTPFSIRLWVLIFFGLLGATPMKWLRKQNLQMKIARVKWRINRLSSGLRSTQTK